MSAGDSIFLAATILVVLSGVAFLFLYRVFREEKKTRERELWEVFLPRFAMSLSVSERIFAEFGATAFEVAERFSKVADTVRAACKIKVEGEEK